jgi:DNA-binding NtrC family response regulator
MPNVAYEQRQQLQYAATLRLRPLAPRGRSRPVLLAGADSAQRAAVLHDLANTLPEGTSFDEAATFWEVLARAPESRMVILSGDLEDGSAQALVRALGHRHPQLPVVSLRTPSLVDI